MCQRLLFRVARPVRLPPLFDPVFWMLRVPIPLLACLGTPSGTTLYCHELAAAYFALAAFVSVLRFSWRAVSWSSPDTAGDVAHFVLTPGRLPLVNSPLFCVGKLYAM